MNVNGTAIATYLIGLGLGFVLGSFFAILSYRGSGFP